MANTTKTTHKFGVVHGTPSQLTAEKIESGKLYFLSGEEANGIKQGVYGVNPLTSDVENGVFDLAMFGTGAVANGTGYGLSQENFTTALKTALNNLSNIGVATKTADGYVPKADASAGTIDSQANDWVLAFDGSKVDWFKLPAEAFNNTTYNSGNVITIASNKNINHNTSGATAGRYGDTGNTRSLEFGGTFKVLDTSVDAYGHITAISTKTLTLPSKPSTAGTADKVAQTFDVSFGGADILTYNGSTNKTLAFDIGANKTIKITNNGGTLTFDTSGVPTTTDMNNAIATALTSALKYKGTVANSSALTSADKTQGSVYVASEKFTTTEAQTGKPYSVEAGDYFISNGTTFDVVNGENQVKQIEHTLSWGADVSVAEIDGTTIKVKLPSNPNTDTKVTTVGNHYTPTADASKELTVDASSTTAATWGTTDLVTGVNIQRDAAGHVTGVTVDSIQMPSNPNSDTKVKDTSVTTKSFILGHKTQGSTAEAETNASCYMSGGYLYSGGSKVLTSATDTKCTSLTLSADTAVEDPSTSTSVNVLLNSQISASGTGTSLTGSVSAVKVPTQKAIDDAKSAAISAATIYWETL